MHTVSRTEVSMTKPAHRLWVTRSRLISQSKVVGYCFCLCFYPVLWHATTPAAGSSGIIAIVTAAMAVRLTRVVHARPQADVMSTDTLDLRISSALSVLNGQYEARDRDKGDLEAANRGEAELRNIAKEYPFYSPPHFFLGLLSQRRGKYEAAVEHYAAALRADPLHADATNNLASALSSLAPRDSARIAVVLGLVPSDSVELLHEVTESVHNSVEAVENVVEALYTRALEVDPTHRWGHNNLGLHLHGRGRNIEAVEVFSRAVELYPEDAELHFHLGIVFQKLGKAQEAADSFVAALNSDLEHVGAALNLATLHHQFGEVGDAVQHYKDVLQMMNNSHDHHTVDDGLLVMLRNNLGTALYQMGEHTLANVEHQAVLNLLQLARTNDQHQYNDNPGDHDVYIDTLVSMHRARKASCDWRDWEDLLFDLVALVDEYQVKVARPSSLLPFDTLLLPYPADPIWRRTIAEMHSGRYARPASTALSQTLKASHSRQPEASEPELHVSFDESHRGTETSRRHSGTIITDGETVLSEKECRERGSAERGNGKDTYEKKQPLSGEQQSQRVRQLHIGFIGHDFDEHPTAHMMEGIFLWQKRLVGSGDVRKEGDSTFDKRPWQPHFQNIFDAQHGGCEIDTSRSVETAAAESLAACCRFSVYSYGGGRGTRKQGHASGRNTTASTVRESIRSLAFSFVDLYSAGHDEAVAKIRADGVDILVDLQGHTLGGRSEIAAARPAPLQVNYLVYPGTSGAPYMDYLLADRHVTPPEHASHYSESLLLLPRTYQANLYEGGASTIPMSRVPSPVLIEGNDRVLLRLKNGLPDDVSRVVLANFNKVDKLDPQSFSLWMQILRRIPGAVLWLLDPSEVEHEGQSTRTRLGDEAEGQGIDRRRIVFAKRVSKLDHLRRHAAADLFVDSLIYGAHSTATDALAGGLPFLSLAGGVFASRVGVSLLRNAGPYQNLLVVTSQREYEDLAVELLTTRSGRNVLEKLRDLLNEGRPNVGPARDTRRLETRRDNWPGEQDRDHEEASQSGIGGGRRDTRGRRSLGNGGGPPIPGKPLPLFDTENITLDIDRAFVLMWEVRREGLLEGEAIPRRKENRSKHPEEEREPRKRRRLPHIVMTGKRNIADVGG